MPVYDHVHTDDLDALYRQIAADGDTVAAVGYYGDNHAGTLVAVITTAAMPAPPSLREQHVADSLGKIEFRKPVGPVTVEHDGTLITFESDGR